jgi:ABC-2 type transport system ATP-binding protein
VLDCDVVKRRLEQVPGVSRVLFKEGRQDHSAFEVEGKSDGAIRGDLARVIVESGWDLNELRAAGASLEEVFLQLTSSEEGNKETVAGRAEGATQ